MDLCKMRRPSNGRVVSKSSLVEGSTLLGDTGRVRTELNNDSRAGVRHGGTRGGQACQQDKTARMRIEMCVREKR